MGVQTYLPEFLATYQLWLEEGAPDQVIFHRKYGLCQNAVCYTDHFFPDSPDAEYVLETELKAALGTTLFTGYAWYYDESRNNACHLNQERNQWIAEKLNQFTG